MFGGDWSALAGTTAILDRMIAFTADASTGDSDKILIFRNENGFQASKFEPSKSTTAPDGGASPSVDIEEPGASLALTVVGLTMNSAAREASKDDQQERVQTRRAAQTGGDRKLRGKFGHL